MAKKMEKPIEPKNRLILIKNYVLSAINLYGVIKIDDFLIVFNQYEKEKLTIEEATPVIELISSIGETGVSVRENILSNYLYFLKDNSDFVEAKKMLAIQASKPRYLPSRNEFLKYTFDDYIEPMKPLLDLEKFISDNKMVAIEDPEDIKYDVLEIRNQIVLGYLMSEYLDYLKTRGYQYKDEIQVRLFAGFIQYLNNNTRMYENNGFTPVELRKLLDDRKVD